MSEETLDAIPDETLAGSDLASVGKPRIRVSGIAVRFDMSPAPVNAAGELPAQRLPANVVEVIVSSAAALGSQDLGGVVADREDAVPPPRRVVGGGGDERLEAGSCLKGVYDASLSEGSDNHALPMCVLKERVGQRRNGRLSKEAGVIDIVKAGSH